MLSKRIDNKEEFLEKVLKDIEEKKRREAPYVFYIGLRAKDSVVKYVKEYIEHNTIYSIEANKCTSCTGTWNIVITVR